MSIRRQCGSCAPFRGGERSTFSTGRPTRSCDSRRFVPMNPDPPVTSTRASPPRPSAVIGSRPGEKEIGLEAAPGAVVHHRVDPGEPEATLAQVGDHLAYEGLPGVELDE